MSALGAEREIWQERAAGLYPLLVAAQAQTRLPFARRLVPSEDDLRTSLYWLPAIGLALGLLWALLSATFLALGVPTFAGAVLVVVVMVASSGLCFERALATTASRGLSRWREVAGQDGAGQDARDDALLATVGVVSLSIALRIAAVAAIAPGMRLEALVAAAVLSRWALSLGPLFLQLRSSSSEVQALLSNVLMVAVVALVVVLCQGASGMLLMLFVVGAMALVTRGAQGVSENLESARSVALAVLILTLLCQ